MKILAFDNSSSTCVVTLQADDQIFISEKLAAMQQAKLILPMINDLLKQAKLTLADLDAIAFGCGPGSFTGVRIATTVAQGLGYGMDIPLIPVSSMALLAQAYSVEESECWVAIDARMEQFYFARYLKTKNSVVRALDTERILLAEEINFLLNSTNNLPTFIGDGWKSVNKGLLYAADTGLASLGKALIELANNLYLEQKVIQAKSAFPTYLR